MNNFDVNCIISTTIQTIDELKEYKNGGDALLLYFDYIKHSRIQKTNKVWCNDTFMIKSTGFGQVRFRNAKNILKELGLIEIIRERTEGGKLGKYYVEIKFIISGKKGLKIINTGSDENLKVVKPTLGETTSNALSNKNKMLVENKENASKKNKQKKEFLEYAENNKNTSMSARLLLAFMNLGYIPKEGETPEDFKKWFEDKILSNHSLPLLEYKYIIDNFETYWSESKKKIKNYKSTFMNNPLLKKYAR